MDQENARMLITAGFEIGSVKDFLRLIPDEEIRVEEARSEAVK